MGGKRGARRTAGTRATLARRGSTGKPNNYKKSGRTDVLLSVFMDVFLEDLYFCLKILFKAR